MAIFGRLFGGKRPEPPAVPGLEAVAERYARAARLRFPGVQAIVELAATPAESRVVLAFPDGGKFDQFLGNVWQRCQASPDSIDAVFETQFASVEQTRARWSDADSGQDGTILPVVKTSAWYDVAQAQLRQSGVPGEAPLLARPFVGDLIVSYVEDRPDAMGYVGAAAARERGLEGDALHAHALRNLERFLPQLRVEGGGGRYAARLDRNYDASMALLFDRWRDRVDVPGDPVLALAARDELLICGSGDAGTVVALQRMATEIVERSDYGLTNRLFVFRGGRLAPLMVARKDDDIVLVELATGERISGTG